MSEPSNRPAPRYVVCNCQHCDGHIEFDANEFSEENNLVPCPHCSLETKIFIPVLQSEKVPTELPPPVANSNNPRSEGFFCGASEILQERVGDEHPATSVPDLTEDQIRSIGKRQNDDIASKLYHEGDQDVAMSLDDARRYIADPRFKLMNPETGVRFTPATLEAFIKTKKLQKKTASSKVELTEGQLNKIWRKCNKLKSEINKSRSKWMDEGERVTLSSAQCELPIVQELIGFLIEIEKEGFITDQGARRLNEWLETKSDSEITAFYFLLDTSRLVLAQGELTMKTAPDIMIAMELQLAIERVLQSTFASRLLQSDLWL
jgi:hypothetical protein